MTILFKIALLESELMWDRLHVSVGISKTSILSVFGKEIKITGIDV